MHDWLAFVDSWAEAWGTNLWRASWQGAIALGMAWIVARTCTFLSPRVVCWVWRVAYVKVLLALVWVQPLSLAVLPPLPAANVVAPAEFVARTAMGGSPVEPAPSREISQAIASEAWSDAVSFASVLMLAWGVGVFWRIAITALQWKVLRRWRRSSAPSSNECLAKLFRDERERLGVGALVRLGISPNAEGPLLTGIWRPLVILPAGIEEQFGERELRIMLAHELLHVKRHDLAWNWLPTVAGWLFFFHPFVWLATRRWCEAQEAACDEALIQGQVTGPADYGRLLVKLAQCLPQEPRATLAAAGVLGVYRNLERRIQGMTRVRPFSFVSLLISGVLLTLVALPTSVPWRLVAQEPNQPADVSKAQPKEPSAARLPGKIYARAMLESKNAAGELEKYFGNIVIDPNTGAWEKIGDLGHNFALSPDGTRALYCTFRPQADASKSSSSDIWMADLKGGKPVQIAEDAILPHWSPDGKSVLYFKGKDSEEGGWRRPTWLLDLATMQAKQLPIPETDEPDDWSREGNWLVTVSDRHPPHGSGYQLYVMHPDGTGERRLTEGGLNCYPEFSPDGKRLVYKRNKSRLGRLIVVNVDGSNSKEIMIEDADGTACPEKASWSPDGKSLVVKVFKWQTRTSDQGTKEKFVMAGGGSDHLEIVAPDGSNRRTLHLQGVDKVLAIEDPQWY